MTNLHILSDPVSAPKRGIKKVIFGVFTHAPCGSMGLQMDTFSFFSFFYTPLTGVSLRYRKCHGEGCGFFAEYAVLFEQNFSSTFCHQTSSTCHTDTTQSGIWSDPPPDPLLLLYCTILYCTVLYCTVLYYIVLYCTVFRGPKGP